MKQIEASRKTNLRSTARVAVGILLIVTSCFKIASTVPLWFTAVMPFASNMWMLAVLVEMLLGLMLITGVGWGRNLCLLCITMFGSFAAIALVLTFRGESTCGCLGRVPLRPWGAALLDLAAITLLLIARSNTEVPAESHTNRKRSAIRYGLLTALVLMAILPATLLHAKYRDTLAVTNPITTGFGNVGTWVSFDIRLQNRGEVSAMIYGVESPKHVRVVSVLPMDVEPGSEGVVKCVLYCGGSSGALATRFKLLTDVKNQRELFIHVNGGVR